MQVIRFLALLPHIKCVLRRCNASLFLKWMPYNLILTQTLRRIDYLIGVVQITFAWKNVALSPCCSTQPANPIRLYNWRWVRIKKAECFSNLGCFVLTRQPNVHLPLSLSSGYLLSESGCENVYLSSKGLNRIQFCRLIFVIVNTLKSSWERLGFSTMRGWDGLKFTKAWSS